MKATDQLLNRALRKVRGGIGEGGVMKDRGIGRRESEKESEEKRGVRASARERERG